MVETYVKIPQADYDKIQAALQFAHIDISHVLSCLGDSDPFSIDRSALKATLCDIEAVYSGKEEL